MRILLDESLPRPLSRLLVGHDVSTVAHEGWAKLANGDLLRQHPPLYDTLEIGQYLRFIAKVKGVPRAQINSEIEREIGRAHV